MPSLISHLTSNLGSLSGNELPKVDLETTNPINDSLHESVVISGAT